MLKGLFFNLAKRFALYPWFRLTRGMTLGTRAALRDKQGRFLLVRHTYAPGWIFPGGGVERGESLLEAMMREVREETGFEITAKPDFIGIYANHKQFRGDHVAVYLVEAYRQVGERRRLEIAEMGFFSADQLPPDTSAGTRRRIAEICSGAEPGEHW